MSITGEAGGPPLRLGVAIADLTAGLLAAHGITLALFARERSGRGQYVDVALFDAVVSLLSYQASASLNGSTRPVRLGNRHPQIAPYDVFPASDGDFFLAVGNDRQFVRLCQAAGLDGLAGDDRFATNPARVANYPTLRDRLVAALRERTRAEWIALLRTAGVPCGAVRDVPDALADPQVEARDMGYSWDEVHDEAEQLEHVVTDRLIGRIDEMLGRPETDPHGDPIPNSDGLVKPQDAQTLLTWPSSSRR